jgi:hypothetical protein
MSEQQQYELIAVSQAFVPKNPLSDEEKEGITLAVKSAFLKLKNLYDKITPVFDEYGFRAPSAGVVARDLSEKIETSIIQHCRTFARGLRHADLARFNKRWEVKICKDSGLTINQSAIIEGENYIVINYKDNSRVKKIWVLWEARDEFFSDRRRNSNARTINQENAKAHIQVIHEDQPRQSRAPEIARA